MLKFLENITNTTEVQNTKLTCTVWCDDEVAAKKKSKTLLIRFNFKQFQYLAAF